MIIEAYRWFFLRLADVVGLGWGVVALSFITSAAMMPLMKAVAGIVKRETDYQTVILPQLAEIKRKFASDAERHIHIQRLYARYGYSPLSAVKKVLPLFVQIPFLLLTYYMLKNTPQLNGVSFLFLHDLGQPDALLKTLGKFPLGLNLLPIVMTLVNMLTVAATPGFTHKDQAQAVGISLLFLVLLYTAPSALLLYWTLNNVITMIRTLAARRGAGLALLVSRVLLLRRLPTVVVGVATRPKVLACASLVLLVVALYMRLMVGLGVWWFNYMASYWLMGIVFAFVIWATYFALRPLMGWRRIVWMVVLVLATAFASGLLVVLGSIVVTFRAIMFVTANVDLALAFDALLIVWLLAMSTTTVCSDVKKAVNDVVSVFRGNWVWLVVSAILAVHYSFASANFKLPFGSVAVLVAYLTVPVAIAAAVFVWMYRRMLPVDGVFRFIVGVCIGIYLVPMISLETGKCLGYGSNLVVRLVLMMSIGVLLLRIRRRMTAAVFVLLLGMAVVCNVVCQKLAPSDGTVEKTSAPSSDVEAVFASLKCARTNNVYFLVYDSYPHDIVLDAFKIPHADLAKELPARGFTRYDAYSLGDNTLPSISSAFSLGGIVKGSARSMLAGNNVFNDCLQRSGYRTSYVLAGYDMPNRGEPMPGDYYFPSPQKVTRPEMVLYPCILVGLLSQSANTFNDYTHEEWIAEKRRQICEASASRFFMYAHSAMPAHAVSNPMYRKSDAEELKAFAERLVLADAEMKEDVDSILSRDKDPLIIIASDHGAYLRIPTGQVGEFNAFDLLDRCGIQLYVRWPKGYQPTLGIQAFPDVFLETLICLTGDKSLVRFKSDGATLPFQYPLKAPAGVIVGGVIQQGKDKGKNLFQAAKSSR